MCEKGGCSYQGNRGLAGEATRSTAPCHCQHQQHAKTKLRERLMIWRMNNGEYLLHGHQFFYMDKNANDMDTVFRLLELIEAHNNKSSDFLVYVGTQSVFGHDAG
jgi:hypothetical protein